MSESSDLDIVCVLHTNCLNNDAMVKWFLFRLREYLYALPEFNRSNIEDQIVGKKTIRCKFDQQLVVDITVHAGDGQHDETTHWPSLTTAAVTFILNTVTSKVHKLCLLVVILAKQLDVCWDRIGSVGSKLKTVHWVLLTLAWWKQNEVEDQGVEDQGLFDTLFWFASFYAEFAFEDQCISALHGIERRQNPNMMYPLWLCDPTDGSANLGCRVTQEELVRIKEFLQIIRLDIEQGGTKLLRRFTSMDQYICNQALSPAYIVMPKAAPPWIAYRDPNVWTAYRDTTTGCIWWYNNETGEVAWSVPF